MIKQIKSPGIPLATDYQYLIFFKIYKFKTSNSAFHYVA